MKILRTEKMKTRGGHPAKNQFIVHTDECRYFKSYTSFVAFKSFDGKVTLDKGTWDYSTTTRRYRNDFLGEGIVDTRKKIEDGEYVLANLN